MRTIRFIIEGTAMDYYKVLGIKRNASKEEIKQTFRKLAMQFHPDKHSHSSKYVRDDAAFRFKQISEAYDVLMDDSKRSQFSGNRSNYDSRCTRDYYNRSSGRNGSYGFNSSSSSAGFGYGYSSPASGNRFMSNVEGFLRFLTTRDFLRNLTFAGALLGAAVILDVSGEALWKKKNTGKSFEDAMESIKDAKAALKEKG